MRPTACIHTLVERAHQDVVAVGGYDQPLHPKAHPRGDLAREDVPEVSRRYNEGGWIAELCRGGEIVDCLRGDASEVDGVHGRQADAARKILVSEELLQELLRVVKSAFDGDGGDIREVRHRHLATLHLADAIVWIEHHDIDVRKVTKRRDRGGAGVAGGGDHDGGAATTLAESPAEQTPE